MSGHYTDGRRWSYISKAWIFADGWNDREEIARLEAKLRQVEQERDQARASTQSLRELVGQWIWAMYLTPESYECRTIETYRQAVEARVRQLEEMVQAELPPPIRRLEQQELLRLRARVGELEAALRASRIGLDDWLNQYASELCDEERVKEARERIADNGGTLAYIAQLQDQNRRALEGKEEHGTKSNA